ncbi:MAG: M20/M25/M40 family metallo-hydrolase [Acidobacteriota bacterium]|nr:M20/M25/M40 family metallo-hydrolase [Acidobacteriota bacterium]
MKRYLLTAFVVCFCLLASPAAAVQEPVDRDIIAKIRDEGLNRSQVYETFTHFTEDIGPRLTGSPAYKAAADWAQTKLKEYGLENPRLESWEFGRGWALDKFSIEMVEPRYMPLIGYPEAWSASMSGEITAAPIFLGDKKQEDITQMRDKLKGAIVMSQPIQTSFERADRPQPTLFDTPVAIGQPRPPAGPAGSFITPQNMAKLLRETGAGVVLRPNRGEHGTLFVLGRDNGEAALPSVVLSAEHYNMIARMIQRGINVKLRVNLQTRFLTEDKNGYNVLAELPGTDPALRDEVVMIGGHLDSWHSSPGATDNADGAAAVMEAMRILKSIGAKPKRTIRMALWGGEEQGLHGSRRYVEKYLAGDANKAAREKFNVYFNLDPGSGPIYGWYLENNPAVKPIFDAWLEPFKDLGTRKNILQGIGNTDHLSYTRAGMAGFNPVQDYVDYDVRTHHTNMDTFERVKAEDLKQCAMVLASFAYHAAVRAEKIPIQAKATER